MPTLTTWEGMAIPFPDGIDHRALGHRLMRATEGTSSPAFRWKHGRLHAAEMVGCIQIGNVRINVLPKLDTGELERDRDFLLNMLSGAGYLSRPRTGAADVQSTSIDPLEALISEVAGEMSTALREGVPRRYEEKREELSTVRGRIDFSKLSSRLPCDRILMPVRYSPLHRDNQLARCVKGIAVLLHRLTRSGRNRQIFAAVLSQLVGVVDEPLTLGRLDALLLARGESHWARSMAVARLLLTGHSPDPTFSGENQAFSMLFPLQHLFERVMRRVLEVALEKLRIPLARRTEPHFLLQDSSDGSGVVRLRPDYILGQPEAPLAVADAKWKRASELGRAHGINREDLYQVHSYLTRFNVRDAVILVPQAKWMRAPWTKMYNVPEGGGHIHLVGVDIEKLVARSSIQRSQALETMSATLSAILLVE